MNLRIAEKVLFPFVIVLFTMVLYTATLCPGVGPTGDSSQFQFIGKILGIPHRTGFPTYILLNWLFIHLVPLRSIAWRVNLMSAFWGSATCLVFYFLLRYLIQNRSLSFLTSLFFCTTHTFWSLSLVANHYTLNLFFFTTIVFLLLKWHRERKDYQLYGALIIYSISLGNHPTIIFLLLAIIYIIFITDRKIFLTRKMLFLVLSMVALDCLVYSYILIRSFQKAPYILEVPILSLRDLFHYISAGELKSVFFRFFPQKIMARVKECFLPSFWGQFFYPALIPLGVFGIFASCRKKIKECFFLLLCAVPLLICVLFLNYGMSFCRGGYVLSIYLIFTVFFCLGAHAVWEFIRAKKIRKLTYVAIISYLLMGILSCVNKNYRDVDQSKNTSMQKKVEKTLSEIGDHALILETDFCSYTAFLYFLLVEEKWKDKDINVVLIPKVTKATISRLIKYLSGTRTIRLHMENRAIPFNLDVYTLDLIPRLWVNPFISMEKVSKITKKPHSYLYRVVLNEKN